MKITVLASGSKGNSCYVEGESGALLIDAGLSARETVRRIEAAGGKTDAVKGLLVTHEHGDHVKGIDVLFRRHLKDYNVPVISTHGTLWELERQVAETETFRPVKTGKVVSVGGFSVELFDTYHDACEPCGFVIRENGSSFGYCTDTGMLCPDITRHLRACDGIVLESNHCPYMLEHGKYPAFLKVRINDPKRGHLSNTAAAAFLKECAAGKEMKVGTVILAHLSEENNTPEKAEVSAYEGLGRFADETTLHVACQHTISESFEL